MCMGNPKESKKNLQSVSSANLQDTRSTHNAQPHFYIFTINMQILELKTWHHWDQAGGIVVRFVHSTLATQDSCIQIPGTDPHTAHEAMLCPCPNAKQRKTGTDVSSETIFLIKKTKTKTKTSHDIIYCHSKGMKYLRNKGSACWNLQNVVKRKTQINGIHIMFRDQKSQHVKDVNCPQTELQIQCNSYQIDKFILKFVWKTITISTKKNIQEESLQSMLRVTTQLQ